MRIDISDHFPGFANSRVVMEFNPSFGMSRDFGDDVLRAELRLGQVYYRILRLDADGQILGVTCTANISDVLRRLADNEAQGYYDSFLDTLGPGRP